MQEVKKEVMEEQTSQVERAGKALARSYFYSFLSRGFAYPNEEVLRDIKTGVKELREAAARLSEGLSKSVDKFSESSGRELAHLDLKDLEGGYNRLFSMGLLCPHHETFYNTVHVFMKSQEIADVQGFYTAFGFKLSDKEKELADFIGTELEFMHVLSYKEYHALEKGEVEKADVCREAEAKFLEMHLGTWVEAFSKTLSTIAHMDYFINTVRLLEEFVEFDCRYLGVSPRKVAMPEDLGRQQAEPLTCGENPQEGELPGR